MPQILQDEGLPDDTTTATTEPKNRNIRGKDRYYYLHENDAYHSYEDAVQQPSQWRRQP